MFNPDQARDERGRWRTGAGQIAAQKHVTRHLRQYFKGLRRAGIGVKFKQPIIAYGRGPRALSKAISFHPRARLVSWQKFRTANDPEAQRYMMTPGMIRAIGQMRKGREVR